MWFGERQKCCPKIFTSESKASHMGVGRGEKWWFFSGNWTIPCVRMQDKQNFNGILNGGGIYNWKESKPIITNCILWNNVASSFGNDIYNDGSLCIPTISYSNILGSNGSSISWDNTLGTDGGGNIDKGPLFIDPNDGNYRLSSNSPCIDTGNPDSEFQPDETDLDGNPRIDNEIVDMGAYEFIHPAKVWIDIKPQSCPNPVNVKSKGVLPVAILGSEVLDVNDIDFDTILLEGITPLRGSYEDVASPVADDTECACTTDGADGYMDMTLKFNTQEILAGLGEVVDDELWMLHLTGNLKDGTPIEGTDCILIKKKVKK